MPEAWKRANATPVFQEGKKEGAGKYTPGSLTSIPAKVMEQLILDTIGKQVEAAKKVIQSSERGFPKGEIMLKQHESLLGWDAWLGR